MKTTEINWIPFPENTPTRADNYPVTTEAGHVRMAWWDGWRWGDCRELEYFQVTHWAYPLEPPYMGRPPRRETQKDLLATIDVIENYSLYLARYFRGRPL